MFNINTHRGYVDEDPSPTSFTTVTQASLESGIDYFGASSDWNVYGVENIQPLQRSQSFASSISQARNVTSAHTESPVSPNDGNIALGLIRPESLPGQEEKRKAQNRNSQRAFRKRQASYITTLESEVKDLRTKYNRLLRCFSKIKEAVDTVGQEVNEIEVETESSVSGSNRKQILTPAWTSPS